MKPEMFCRNRRGRTVARFELVEARAVDEAGDDLAHVVGFAGVLRDDAVEFGGIVERLLARLHGDPHLRHAVEVSDDPARQVDGVGIVLGELVGDARNPCMNVTATEVLGADLLSRRRLHQRGAPKKIVPWLRTMTVSSLMAGT